MYIIDHEDLEYFLLKIILEMALKMSSNRMSMTVFFSFFFFLV